MNEISEGGPPVKEILSNSEQQVVEPELTKDGVLDVCQKAASFITIPNLEPTSLHDKDKISACLQLAHQRTAKEAQGNYEEDGTFHFPLPDDPVEQNNLGIKYGTIEGLTVKDGIVSGKANLEDTYTCLRLVKESGRISNEDEIEIKQLLKTLTSHTLVTVGGEKMTYSDYEKKKKNREIPDDSEISFSLLAKKEVSPDQQTSYSEKTLKPEDLGRLNASAEAIDGELRQVYEPIYERLNRGAKIEPSEGYGAVNTLSAELILAPSLEEGQDPEEQLPDIVYQQRLVSKLAMLETLSGEDDNVSKLIEEAKIALGESKETPTDEVVAKISSEFLELACRQASIGITQEEIESLQKVGFDLNELATMDEEKQKSHIQTLLDQLINKKGSDEDVENFNSLMSKIFNKEGQLNGKLATRMRHLLFGEDETSRQNSKLSNLEPGTLEKIGRFAVNNSPPGLMLRLGKSLGRKETYSKQNLIMAGMLIGTLFPQLISSLLSEE